MDASTSTQGLPALPSGCIETHILPLNWAGHVCYVLCTTHLYGAEALAECFCCCAGARGRHADIRDTSCAALGMHGLQDSSRFQFNVIGLESCIASDSHISKCLAIFKHAILHNALHISTDGLDSCRTPFPGVVKQHSPSALAKEVYDTAVTFGQNELPSLNSMRLRVRAPDESYDSWIDTMALLDAPMQTTAQFLIGCTLLIAHELRPVVGSQVALTHEPRMKKLDKSRRRRLKRSAQLLCSVVNKVALTEGRRALNLFPCLIRAIPSMPTKTLLDGSDQLRVDVGNELALMLIQAPPIAFDSEQSWNVDLQLSDALNVPLWQIEHLLVPHCHEAIKSTLKLLICAFGNSVPEILFHCVPPLVCHDLSENVDRLVALTFKHGQIVGECLGALIDDGQISRRSDPHHWTAHRLDLTCPIILSPEQRALWEDRASILLAHTFPARCTIDFFEERGRALLPLVSRMLPTIQRMGLKRREAADQMCTLLLACTSFGDSDWKHYTLQLADDLRPRHPDLRAALVSRRFLLSTMYPKKIQFAHPSGRHKTTSSTALTSLPVRYHLDFAQGYINNGELDQAQNCLDIVQQIAATTQLGRPEMHRLGFARTRVLRFSGHFEKAAAILEGLFLEEELPRFSLSLVLSQLTAVWYEVGAFQRAIDTLREHIGFMEECAWGGLPRVHEWRISLAEGYLGLGRYEDASTILLAMGAIYFPLQSPGLYQKQLRLRIRIRLAQIKHLQHDWLEAGRLWTLALRDAMTYRFRSDEMIILYSQAHVYRQQHDSRAALCLARAEAEFAKSARHFWYSRLGTYWLGYIRGELTT